MLDTCLTIAAMLLSTVCLLIALREKRQGRMLHALWYLGMAILLWGPH